MKLIIIPIFIKELSPNDESYLQKKVIIASINVDPDLGKPIINIGEISSNK